MRKEKKTITRANVLWKMAEYVVATYDTSSSNINDYINEWKRVASSANNQYLLLEVHPSQWEMYDAQGHILGGEDVIRNHFSKKISDTTTPLRKPLFEKRLIFQEDKISEFMAQCVVEFLKYDKDLSQAHTVLKSNKSTVGFNNCQFGKLKEVQDDVTDSRRQNDCDKNIKWIFGENEYYFYKEQRIDNLKIFRDEFNEIYKQVYYIEIDEVQGVYRLHKLYKLPLQCIFYGAPGTGKSHTINGQTKGFDVIRTTFHPDSDYSTFVGAYKPHMGDSKPIYGFDSSGNTVNVVDTKGKEIKEQKIEYIFVKQAFLKAYLLAWKKYVDGVKDTSAVTATALTGGGDGEQSITDNPNLNKVPTKTESAENHSYKPVFLVIEEINRGNCAQIFGDIFQLLDRQGNGFSEYPIEADSDLQEAIAKELQEVDIKVDWALTNYKSTINGSTLSQDIKAGRILLLPNNFYIWATMNTSDQSLFPMDSAFKRRWDWECVPIGYNNEKSKNFTITINGKKYNWHDFLKEVNQRILKATGSEDKQMGNFFIKGDVDEKQFINKVMFYLWNDVCKEEYGTENNFFRYYKDSEEKTEPFTFNKLFESDAKDTLRKFMEFLKVYDEETKKKKSESKE